MNDREMAAETKRPVIVECPAYESASVRKALTEAIAMTGGLDWVKPGMRIGVKLNLCSARKPEHAATTHPVMAAELTKLLLEHGAEVVLGDSPGEPFTPAMLKLVYNTTGVRLCEEAGGRLNDDFSHHEVLFPEGKSVKKFEYCSWLSGCDAIISFCKLKSHGLMGMTAAVKNLYGVIPGTMKSEYHFMHRDPMDFADMLVDLNEYVKPALCLCDAVEIMEGNGPTQGTPRHLGLLIAGKSSYEMDRLCAAILRISEDEIPYMTAARRRGFLSEDGASNYAAEAAGYGIADFVRSGATSGWFSTADGDKRVKKILKKGLYVLMRFRPEPDEGCTGCGHCARGCPAKAIEIVKGKARISRRKCVRCFCCQEFCPTGAMKVRRSLVARIAAK